MFHPTFITLSFCLIYLLVHSFPLSTTEHHVSLSVTSTATSQFSHLNTIPFSYLLTCTSSRFHHFKSENTSIYLITLILLLSGDIELNPGPVTNSFNLCTLNIRSLLKPQHYTAISDLAETHHVDLFALQETFISPATTSAEIADSIPPGFTLISTPRPVSPNNSSNIVGGGTAFLIRDPCVILSSPSCKFKSFEISVVTLKLIHSKLTVFNIYRPPPTPAKSRLSSSFSQFLIDFHDLLSIAATLPHQFVITGDFNLHLDKPEHPQVKQFLSTLTSANLSQHVHFPTHRDNHTLDLVITHSDSTLLPVITSSPLSPSDHFPIFSLLTIASLSHPPLSQRSFRCLNSINVSKFTHDLLCSRLVNHPPTDLNALVDSYNSTLASLLDKHAPIKTKTVRSKPHQPWFTSALSKLKSARRRLERLWRSTHSTHDLRLFRSATNHYHAAIISAKKVYNSNIISSNLSQPRKLWNSVNKLLHRKSDSLLPTSHSITSLPHMFAQFFSDKIHKLHFNLLSNSTTTSPHSVSPSPPASLSHFSAVTPDELTKLISQASDAYCDLDPIPTSLLKKCASVLIPTITKIINLSLSTGVFPHHFKSSLVLPHLKKANLDREDLANYRPISHLSFLSKLTETVVKSRLSQHLSTNALFNSFQSAYTKSHSTESTLLAVHNHIITAMAHQKVTALCLLDLSAAFDTIDHSILIDRLSSWFGLTGSVLNWFRSYLTSRSFKVSINGNVSSVFQLLYGVPQGSVLGPLLFILYTTPLSSVISNSSLNHHLYADDTQLYLSFSPLAFTHNISILQQAISKVSSWMSANLLALNQSKTEFLLFGLPKQLSKISNPVLNIDSNISIIPVSSARNLGVIFDSTLSMSDHISAISKSCFCHIRDLRRIRNTLDLTTAKTIATSLIHSRLDYCNSLFLNLPHTQLHRLQLVLNSAARAVSKTRKFNHISPVLKSLHWLKINQRIQYKIISLTYNILQTQQPSYLYTFLSPQSHNNTRSSSVITLARPSTTSSLKITNRSFSHHAPVLWNSLPLDMRQPASTPSSHSTTSQPLLLSNSQFHSRLKTFLFYKSFPP